MNPSQTPGIMSTSPSDPSSETFWEWSNIIQLILAVIGVLGNLQVMLVLFRPGRRKCATDTLIGALAVADFLTSIFIIPHPKLETLPDTPSGQLYCRIIDSFVFMWISICASIFTLVTISIERLIAVRYPIAFKRLFTPARTSLVVIIIWIISFIINIFSFFVHYVDDSGKCDTKSPSPKFRKFIGVALFLVKYLVPVVIMATTHVLSIRSLRQRRASILRRAKYQVHKMLLIVVITFIICWTPDQFGFLLFMFRIGIFDDDYRRSSLYRSFVILAFANSCVNPFIYAARSPSFRKGLREFYGGKKRTSMIYGFPTVEDDNL